MIKFETKTQSFLKMKSKRFLYITRLLVGI